jgi:hypothetical protein
MISTKCVLLWDTRQEVPNMLLREHLVQNIKSKFKITSKAAIKRLRSLVAAICSASHLTTLASATTALASLFDRGRQNCSLPNLYWPAPHFDICQQGHYQPGRNQGVENFCSPFPQYTQQGKEIEDVDVEDIVKLMASPVPSGSPYSNWNNSHTNSVQCEMGAGAAPGLNSWSGFWCFPPPIAILRKVLKKAGFVVEHELEEHGMLDGIDKLDLNRAGITFSRILHQEVPNYSVTSSSS